MEDVRRLHGLKQSLSKDHYPLPNIDQLINATTAYSLLSFLDAFSRYHHIAIVDEYTSKTLFITQNTMVEEDIPYTLFITLNGTYQYIKMPFGMLNAVATY